MFKIIKIDERRFGDEFEGIGKIYDLFPKLFRLTHQRIINVKREYVFLLKYDLLGFSNRHEINVSQKNYCLVHFY